MALFLYDGAGQKRKNRLCEMKRIQNDRNSQIDRTSERTEKLQTDDHEHMHTLLCQQLSLFPVSSPCFCAQPTSDLTIIYAAPLKLLKAQPCRFTLRFARNYSPWSHIPIATVTKGKRRRNKSTPNVVSVTMLIRTRVTVGSSSDDR